MMGACWAGAAYVPIGLKLPQDRILAILAACELTAIIADSEGAKLLTDAVLAACPPIMIRHGLQKPLDGGLWGHPKFVQRQWQSMWHASQHSSPSKTATGLSDFDLSSAFV